MSIDGNRLVLIVNTRTETPVTAHEFRVLAQDTSLSHALAVLVGQLGPHGLPSHAITTEPRSRDWQTAETVEDGKGTVLVHESSLDVVGCRWVGIFREVDGTVGIGGCCQNSRRHTRQAEVTLEQTPGLQDIQKNTPEARRELVLVPVKGSDRT